MALLGYRGCRSGVCHWRSFGDGMTLVFYDEQTRKAARDTLRLLQLAAIQKVADEEGGGEVLCEWLLRDEAGDLTGCEWRSALVMGG